MLVEVAFPLPIDTTFTYDLPEGVQNVTVGQRVLAPFQRRKMTGYVVGRPAAAVDFDVKRIETVFDEVPLLTDDLIELARGMAQHYGTSFGKALQTLLPPGLSRVSKKPRKKNEKKNQDQNPFENAPSVYLTEAQTNVARAIFSALDQSSFCSFLLHGITGSGKTEIYLQAAARTLGTGRTVLALVPEISLTPQFVGRFRARFGEQIAVLHSARSEGERVSEWKRIRSGEAKVVIGARSAVFAPLEKIGLVVVDEEHDGSYKQDEGFPYNGRELARVRARRWGATLLLGSATPSLESYEATSRGEIQLLELSMRATEHDLPRVEIVDLRSEISKFGEKGIFSNRLRDAIAERLEQNEQVVLFLNRRGFAPLVFCPKCGGTLRCANCSVALTFHAEEKEHLCHYCGIGLPNDSPCSACGQAGLLRLGVGTERVEMELRYLFPDARIERMDRDTVRRRGSHEALLRKLAKREIDILIGTQMITKGLDLPHVSLVGVLLADQSLHFPDFRAAERTFQLLTQVVGRSGRGAEKGSAIIQTFQPGHYAIATAATQNFKSFYSKEIEFRKELNYPPFSELALLELSGGDPDAVRRAAIWLARQCERLKQERKKELDWLGPAPAPIRRLQGKTRYHLILRSPAATPLSPLARWITATARPLLANQKVDLKLDIDPYQFL